MGCIMTPCPPRQQLTLFAAFVPLAAMWWVLFAAWMVSEAWRTRGWRRV
jgi:hypothetical protein